MVTDACRNVRRKVVPSLVMMAIVYATTDSTDYSTAAHAEETARSARISFRIRDEQGAALACRVHLRDAKGKSPQTKKYPFWYDHFVCNGSATIEIPPGEYRYLLERGPEYRRVGGHLILAAGEQRQIVRTLTRAIQLREFGWYSADLHIHRPPEQIKLLMRSSDLDIGPVITWWNKTNRLGADRVVDPVWVPFDKHRYYSITAGEDERNGGALMYYGMPQSIDITTAESESPSPLDFVRIAKQQTPDVWIDIEKPFWWDVPIWLASEQVHSIGLANNHMCWGRMFEDEAWGKPRDALRLPAPLGNGHWTQEIYYHILNSGIRIPPSAGSASGVLPSPVGYNRVYVFVAQPFEPDAWWNGLRAGRCFVTNGPLLNCRANGQLPGSELSSDEATMNVELDIDLTTQDYVPAVEVVCNGKIIHTVPLERAERQTIQTHFECPSTGWFLVRAITDHPDTFRFASTGPFYVQHPDQPRYISRASAKFFADWVAERTARVTAALDDGELRDQVLVHHGRAREFWQNKLTAATAD